ncbi:ABC-2 type transport system permease protein [Streptomyces sp. DfronAA-171]|nr:ABC-2 type transport system permease protein [Streptomyces sp. DfronAA-171]
MTHLGSSWPPPLPANGAEAAPASARADGYRPGRTLPVRVELRRQLTRRRTAVMGAVLFLLPFVLAVAFAVGGTPGGDGANGQRGTLMDAATRSGADFAAVCLFVSAGFLLVVPVALFCGDTVAAEADWSTLRYLLAAPVARHRLLASKLVVALACSLAAMILLPLVGLLLGTALYGWGPLELPTGDSVSAGAAVPRLALAVAYLFVSQLVTAALAFWLSTRTDAPSARSAARSASRSSATSWTPSPPSGTGATSCPPTGSSPGPTSSPPTSPGRARRRERRSR